MKEIIVSARTIEKAIENGLNELGAKFEDVNVEVLSEGGFFSKAKVKITIESKEPEVKTEAKEVSTKVEPAKETTETKKEKPSKVEKPAENKAEVKAEVKEPAKKEIVNTNITDFVKEVLSSVIENIDVQSSEDENSIKIMISGDNLSGIIGNKGEGLRNLQYLVHMVNIKRGDNRKVYIDAGDYKKGREDRVKELAVKYIEKAKETGRWQKLKPMSSYERRIVHAVVNEVEGVHIESKGEEPYRYVVIYLDK